MMRFESLKAHLRFTFEDENGASLLELGLILPIFLMFLLGSFDFAYAYYGRSVLIGAVQDAGRFASLEKYNTDQTALDNLVKRRLSAVNPRATFDFKRRSIRDFTSIGKPEPYTDSNGNGTCDNGERYDDLNGDRSWSSDGSRSGQGAASEVVIYTVKMNFPLYFGSTGFLGQSSTPQIAAQTVLRNQPFEAQRAVTTRSC